MVKGGQFIVVVVLVVFNRSGTRRSTSSLWSCYNYSELL